MDPQQQRRIEANTLRNYKAAVLHFTTWAIFWGFSPSTPEEWDDCLVEWKNSDPRTTKAAFSTVVAAVEFFFARLRHQMQWSRSILIGWERENPTHHTVPLGKWPSKMIACHMASRGRPRLGLGVVVQSHCGLRPSEMLALLPEHVVLPEDSGSSLDRSPAILGLGMKKGTKVKRAQTVRLDARLRDIVDLLRECRAATPPGCRMFPHTLRQYSDELKKIDVEVLGLKAGWTPHSPRAGFASDSRAEGWSFEEIREMGRWQADSSLRIYLDVIGAADIAIKIRAQGFGDALRWASANWWRYFPSSVW